ncbi:hypothetical protein [Listeria sp. PSOL-1]|uniref:hypothetical protein n=1 Tax=Listeria sp. PSOL-1 TaxID=1844999 RepID=UPI0013D4D7E4|nr:hypothetical protein [Listeria sp. PSOL-1]
MNNFRLWRYSRVLFSQKWPAMLLISLFINLVVFFNFIYRYLKLHYSVIQILGELSASSRLLFFMVPTLLILIAILPEMRVIDLLNYKGRNSEIVYHGIKFIFSVSIVFVPLFSQYCLYLLFDVASFVYFGPTVLFQLEFFLIIWLFYFVLLQLLKNKVIAFIFTYLLVFLDYFVLFSKFKMSLFWDKSAALFWNQQTIELVSQFYLLGIIVLLCGVLLLVIYRKDYLS